MANTDARKNLYILLSQFALRWYECNGISARPCKWDTSYAKQMALSGKDRCPKNIIQIFVILYGKCP